MGPDCRHGAYIEGTVTDHHTRQLAQAKITVNVDSDKRTRTRHEQFAMDITFLPLLPARNVLGGQVDAHWLQDASSRAL